MAAASPTPYRRLARSASLSPVRHSLWYNSSHLLQVLNQHFSEQYQRFYYTDIQAIIVQATPRRRRIALTLGMALGLHLGLILLVTLDNQRAALWLGIPFVPLLGLWVANWLLGPTCVCLVQTAVQTERLAAIDRRRTAERLLGLVQPLIQQAQGELSPTAAEQAAAQLSAPPPLDRASQLRQPPLPVPLAPRHCSGRLHQALAALLLVHVLWAAVDIVHELSGGFWDTAGVLLGLLGLFLLIGCVIHQAGSDLPVRLKWLTWGLLAFFSITLVAGIGLGLASAIAEDLGSSLLEDRMVMLYLDLVSVMFLLPGGWLLWRGVQQWRRK